MIHIVDYGCGNIASVASMLRRLQVECKISTNAASLHSATKVILPGVGTFDSGMRGIRERELHDVLRYKALEERVPVFGICLGAQLMTAGSEEGVEPGLGWLPARTVKFDFGARDVPVLPLPNIGWRDVYEPCEGARPSTQSAEEVARRFYFVHKYHFEAANEITWMRSMYGYEFASALRMDNLWSVQFHPEKSHRYGMRLLSAFAAGTLA